MKIIIPMSGSGQRYINAGYTDIKPLIPVDEKPMVEHVVNMFPGETDFVFICSQEHLATTALRSELERICPGGKIVAIPPHKKGPVFAVTQILDLIDDEEEVVVNYCDFAQEWDWSAVKKEMRERRCDGAVPAYRGFHPHTLGNTYYAYMRNDADNWMLDIQEKASYTDNRMQEFASSGTYCFSRGAWIKKYFPALMNRTDLEINGEQYVSLVYRLMLADGLRIWIPEVRVMLQWGTPQDLQEYQNWSNYFRHAYGFTPTRRFPGQVLVPMAGAGSRFAQEGYSLVKPLIPVDGLPMVVRAVQSLPKMDRHIFVCRTEHLQESDLENVLTHSFGIQTRLIDINYLTEGQASTCLLARDLLQADQPLMIGACDNGMVWNEQAFADVIADESVDAVAWTFRNYPGAVHNPQMYGWVRTREHGDIESVSVKKPISDQPAADPGIVGAFWFRRADLFLHATEKMITDNLRINNEFYVDAVFNTLNTLGCRARVFDIDRYLCWGTPNDLRTWEYWQGYSTRTGQQHGKNKP